MPLWIYHLPVWQFCGLVLAGWMVPAQVCYETVHRLWKPLFNDSERGVAMTLLSLVATLNSLLLAFCAVSVWDGYRSADTAVNNEAISLAQLGRDLSVYGTPEALEARERTREYIQSIVDIEWPQMQEDPTRHFHSVRIDRVFRALQRIEPHNAREGVLLAEIWTRTNEVLKFRRERIGSGEACVPGTFWFVIVVGGALSLVPLLVLPANAFNRLAMAFVALSTGMVFFFIAYMDRPYVGDQSVSRQPFISTLDAMDSWDRGPQ